MTGINLKSFFTSLRMTIENGYESVLHCYDFFAYEILEWGTSTDLIFGVVNDDGRKAIRIRNVHDDALNIFQQNFFPFSVFIEHSEVLGFHTFSNLPNLDTVYCALYDMLFITRAVTLTITV